MKRSDLLAYMRIAGYHGDTRSFMRLLCENRISKQVADAAYQKGQEQKSAGMKCSCMQCNKT